MINNKSLKNNIIDIFIYAILFIVMISCILPFIHIFAISLSSSAPASAGLVGLLPKGFSTKSWEEVLGYKDFWRAFSISVIRVVAGTSLSLFLVILTAYPLSKESREFKGRTVYVWFFFFTTLVGGGLIPTYFLLSKMNLINSIWVLILPGAMNVFNMVLMLNFFRQIPKELEEAAFLDGAGYWRSLWSIIVPTSRPAIATITLFTAVGHWNSWFDGLIYMDTPAKYPLQTYAQTILVTIDTSKGITADDLANLLLFNDRTLRAAIIIVAAIPVLIVYPFFQKHLSKGIVIGSVKG